MLCGVLVCVKSRLTAISSTANYVLPALCVHSNFTNPGNCCHWSKLLPGRNKEAEQKWHGLISYYELWVWMDTDLCQLDIWWRFEVKVAINFLCQMLWSEQWSMLFVYTRDDRNEKLNQTNIFLWHSYCFHWFNVKWLFRLFTSNYLHQMLYCKCT